MTLAAGASLGPYTILGRIGAGAMGEVYRNWRRLPRGKPAWQRGLMQRGLGIVLILSVAPCLALGQLQTAQSPKQRPDGQQLAYWVGTWKSETELKVGDPSHPAGKFSSTDSCEWFAGGFHVVCRGEGTGPRGKMTDLLIRAYDTEAEVYTEYFISSRGETESDKMILSGNTWMSTWEGQEAGKPAKFRFTEVEESPTSYTFKIEKSVAGEPWTVVEGGKATKVAGEATKVVGGTAYRIGKDVSAPILVKEVKPQWNAKIQGVVVVECVVMADGVVGDARVIRSLDSALDQEAIKAVKQWRFKPGMKDGKPVPVWVTVELTFSPYHADQQD